MQNIFKINANRLIFLFTYFKYAYIIHCIVNQLILKGIKMSVIEKFLASGLAFAAVSLLMNGAIFYTLAQAYIAKFAVLLLILN